VAGVQVISGNDPRPTPEKVCDAAWEPGNVRSVTLTVKLYGPVAVDVPLTVAPPSFLVASDRPAGRAPALIAHAYGGVPPLAVQLVEYGTPLTGPVAGVHDMVSVAPMEPV